MFIRDLESLCEVVRSRLRSLVELVVVEQVGSVSVDKGAAVRRGVSLSRSRCGEGKEKTHKASPSCQLRVKSLTSTSS